MTCVRFDGPATQMIVCVNAAGRLHIGDRYIYVDYHPYCGPSFSWDRSGNQILDIDDESPLWIPLWDAFDVWHKKQKAAKEMKLNKKTRATTKEAMKKIKDKPSDVCVACSGSGRYDTTGSPKCGACNGTGKNVDAR